ALLLDLLDELRRDLPQPLHVPAVARVEHAPRNLVADFPAVLDHHGTLAQHPLVDHELLEHDRRRPFLARELESHLPARDRELARDVLGELYRLGRAVAHAEQRERRAEAEEAHAVAPLAKDLVALL